MRILKWFIQIIEYIRRKINDTNIFKKLIVAFIIIIIVPQTISYYMSEKIVVDLIVTQVSSETMNSIQLVSDNIDSLVKRMNSIALYVNEDKNIKELITDETSSYENSGSANSAIESLKKLERINKFNSFIRNMAFNMVGTKCYITIYTPAKQKYTSWTNNSYQLDSSFDLYLAEKSKHRDTNLIWSGLENNYVESDVKLNPYILTLTKNIFNSTGEKQYGTFMISIPENEISRLMSAGNEVEKRVIVDQDMNIISSTAKEWLNQPLKSILDVDLPRGGKGYFISRGGNDGDLIVSYNTIQKWKIIDIKSYSAITKQLGASRANLLLMNTIFLLSFLTISAIFAKNISNPLRKLANMMLKTDFESSFSEELITRNDEVGVLEKSFNTMRRNIKALMQDNIDTERKKRNSEMKMLQAQISPHFLFNTLNTIRWAAINNNTQKVADMVLALSNLLRMTIVNADELITLDEEIENLRNYVTIFQMRHSIAFSFVCDITDEDIKQYRIPKLLLQPLVENSIVHGFEGISYSGTVTVSAEKQDHFIVIYVSDNGVGMDVSKKESKSDTNGLKFSGIGSNNVDERIKLYFGDAYGLKIRSTIGEGTVVEVWLPQ